MRRRPCRRPVISLCNIVLHLLVRHTALLRRLSSHSAHSTHFPFSNRFLEVPYNDAGRIHDTIYHYSTPLYYLFPEYFGATADAAVLCSLLFRTVPSFLTGSLDLFLFSAPVFLMTPCSTCRFFLLTYPYQFRYFLLTFRKKSDIIQNEQCSFWR